MSTFSHRAEQPAPNEIVWQLYPFPSFLQEDFDGAFKRAIIIDINEESRGAERW